MVTLPLLNIVKSVNETIERFFHNIILNKYYYNKRINGQGLATI